MAAVQDVAIRSVEVRTIEVVRGGVNSITGLVRRKILNFSSLVIVRLLLDISRVGFVFPEVFPTSVRHSGLPMRLRVVDFHKAGMLSLSSLIPAVTNSFSLLGTKGTINLPVSKEVRVD